MDDQAIASTQQRRAPLLRGRQKASGSAELATVSQAAELLGVSQMTVRRSIYDGELPVIKFRGRYHIPRRFLHGLVEAANSGQQVEVAQHGAAWHAEAAGEVA